MIILRLLHAMPRCGSTLLSANLASIPNVILMSEMHPSNLVSHPCDQACHWHNLLTPNESEVWKRRYSCSEILLLLNQQVTATGKTLVVREWSYCDFKHAELPEPLLPTWWSSLARLCHPVTTLLRVSLVRDPVDQWLSFREFNARTGRLHPDDLASCMLSYRKFAEMASTMPRVKFENFAREPEKTLKYVCSVLSLPYEDTGDAWRTYAKLTGDPERMRSFHKIEILPAKSVDAETIRQLRDNPDYLGTCRLLNYPVR